MKINIQIFGGGGGPSGGSYKGNRKPPINFYPNSQYTQYGKKGQKHQTRYYDKNGKPKYDIDYDGPRGGHSYPHKHVWDKNGNRSKPMPL